MQKILDERSSWTDKQWADYDAALAEIYEAEDEQMAKDFEEDQADYFIDQQKENWDG